MHPLCTMIKAPTVPTGLYRGDKWSLGPQKMGEGMAVKWVSCPPSQQAQTAPGSPQLDLSANWDQHSSVRSWRCQRQTNKQTWLQDGEAWCQGLPVASQRVLVTQSVSGMTNNWFCMWPENADPLKPQDRKYIREGQTQKISQTHPAPNSMSIWELWQGGSSGATSLTN